MPVSTTITTTEKIDVGVTILDRDLQPFATVPEGAVVEFVSSDPSVISVEIHPDGLNATLRSGVVGTATVTVDAVFPDNTPDLPSDTVEVTVRNAVAGSINLTLGQPSEEGEPPLEARAAAARARTATPPRRADRPG